MTSVPPHASLPWVTHCRKHGGGGRCGKRKRFREERRRAARHDLASNKCVTVLTRWGGRWTEQICSRKKKKSRPVPLEAELRSGENELWHFKGILTRNCVDTKPAELMISLSRLVSLRSGRTKLNAGSQSLQ